MCVPSDATDCAEIFSRGSPFIVFAKIPNHPLFMGNSRGICKGMLMTHVFTCSCQLTE